MIFVTIGTSNPFDRLLAAVAALPTTERLVVQAGTSRIRPVHAELIDFAPFDRVAEMMREARVVVTHAGAGSVLAALQLGRRPVVIPRLRRYGEAVDDHQLVFGRRLGELGFVTLVEDPRDLPRALSTAAPDASPLSAGSPLAWELREYIGVELRAAGRSVLAQT